ncbi:HEAT repeat domain-containing protein [Pedosphaera parvula]|uniref:HEAT domain containing protein n=1 Tax=Pedosphaera parvula (strain Ellin514) TaxID=320771 RepID=B9XLL6_PEDPL|nr:HEAT repeat domain-containing protein [Pedosphaera parvula]EEF59264.1 HEAT domain containing protein [Pedosphaera parvula Ellin514]
MRRRTIIIPLLLIFATAIGLSLRNYHPEPEYQNHPLSYWLDYNPREENHIAAELRYKAIQTIGTNALPVYISWLRSKDSYPKQLIMKLLALIHIHVRSAVERRDLAMLGWQVAQLSHEVINPNVWEELSWLEIGGCGLESEGQEQRTINSLLHGTPEQRESAARVMHRYFYSPESIDALTSALKDPSSRVRYFAARSLALSSENSKPAIPALIQSLQDKNEFVRMTAAFALGKFGRGATSARTSLQPLLKDPNIDVRACAKLALQQIDAKEIVIQAKK